MMSCFFIYWQCDIVHGQVVVQNCAFAALFLCLEFYAVQRMALYVEEREGYMHFRGAVCSCTSGISTEGLARKQEPFTH